MGASKFPDSDQDLEMWAHADQHFSAAGIDYGRTVHVEVYAQARMKRMWNDGELEFQFKYPEEVPRKGRG